MQDKQIQAILAIAIHAAFADGEKDEREREALRRVAENLAGEEGAPDLTRLYQDVLLKRASLAAATGVLEDIGARQFAYEVALGVCEADGRLVESERVFLAQLRDLLALSGETSARIEADSTPSLAALDHGVSPLATAGAAAAAGAGVAAGVAAAASSAWGASGENSAVSTTEQDKNILNMALICGALELLPQSWASMAIIPLQIKLVYNIGKAHGVALDQGHIKEFIAAAGVGMTSQYLEQFGRKLLGGLLGKAAGKTFGKLGSTATGMAFSFATTYALGQVAQRYYAGGRVMSSAVLRDSFQGLLGPAKQLQAQYLPQIEQKAATLDAGQITALLRA